MLKKEEVWCSPNDYIIILQIERPVSTLNALFCFVRVLQPYVNAVCFSSPRIAAMFILKSHRLTPGLFVCYFSQESGSNCEGQLLFWCLAPKQKHQRVLFGKSTRETNSCTGRSTIVFFVFFFLYQVLSGLIHFCSAVVMRTSFWTAGYPSAFSHENNFAGYATRLTAVL